MDSITYFVNYALKNIHKFLTELLLSHGEAAERARSTEGKRGLGLVMRTARGFKLRYTDLSIHRLDRSDRSKL